LSIAKEDSDSWEDFNDEEKKSKSKANKAMK
jgi:hypothetical protein